MERGIKMNKLKVLNLYTGIGGNRKLWDNDLVEVTAVENVPEIAKIYQDFFPNDKVVITDAHEYLLEHYKEFDFIWSSPPCPTHSRIRYSQPIKIYADMNLYQEILFLKTWFKGKWVIENVIPYYKPLIEAQKLGRHLFWSNFNIPFKEFDEPVIRRATKESMAEHYNMPITKRLYLRNCVNPEIGLHILNCSYKDGEGN